MKLAPIILFVYKRKDTLIKTVESLSKNNLAETSDLIIFSDAAKNEVDKHKVLAVRNYIDTITGFRNITIHKSITNKGLAQSIIEGVTEVLKEYENVIVLEDDLMCSNNFLDYMNQGLNYYKKNTTIFSITGFSIPIKTNIDSDVYFSMRSSSWGWGIWKDRWMEVDWAVSDHKSFSSNKKERREFNLMGSDMSGMLKRQMLGELDSWAIRWCYHQFKKKMFSVHPIVSKIQNIGFNSEDASNTKEKFNRYSTQLDNSNKHEFNFNPNPHRDESILLQFVKPFSLKTRIKYKILRLFGLN